MDGLTKEKAISEVACMYLMYLMDMGRRMSPTTDNYRFWAHLETKYYAAFYPLGWIALYDDVSIFMRTMFHNFKIPKKDISMDMLIPDGLKLQREDVITCLPIPQRAFDAMVDVSTRFNLHTDNGVPFVYRRAGDKTAIILCVREGDDPVAEVAWMRMIKGRTELIYIVGASEQALSAPELISRAMGTRRETLVDLTEGEIGDEPR